MRRALVAAAVALSLFGLAQTLYLRAEVVRVAEEMAHALTHSEQGRAFLGSWRATATFISPNAFGGFLLLAGIPLVAAAVAAMAGASTRSEKTRAAIAVAIVAGGFACTGSAGAAVAAALGLTLAGWMSAKSRRARIAFGLGADADHPRDRRCPDRCRDRVGACRESSGRCRSGSITTRPDSACSTRRGRRAPDSSRQAA